MGTIGIGSEWEHVAPDCPVWSENLLASAALEITERSDPLKPPETPDANDNTEKVRLMCEKAALRRDHKILESKHNELEQQLRALNRRKKR